MGCRYPRSSCIVPSPITSCLRTGLTQSDTLRHGHYVLAICTFGMVLVIVYGHNALTDHAHFIPVYAMGSTFMIAAWPSLEDSWTRLRRDQYNHLPMQEFPGTPAVLHVPMAEVRVNHPGQRSPRASMSNWLRDQSRQRSSPSPVSPPPSLVGRQILSEQQVDAAWMYELQHMGPASHRSQALTHTGTSISLSSRPAVPSEISANAFEVLCPGDTVRALRATQRRLDIERLTFMPREGPPPISSLVADRSRALSA